MAANVTRAMREALGLLATSPVELRGRDPWRCAFRTPGGWTVPRHTVDGLVRRGLARTAGPFNERVELTDAGRRLAATLSHPKAA